VLRDAPLLRTLGGRPLALVDLAEIRRRGEKILFVDVQAPAAADGEELVLRLSADGASVLRRLFEEHAIEEAPLRAARGGRRTTRTAEPVSARPERSRGAPGPAAPAVELRFAEPEGQAPTSAAVETMSVFAEPEVLSTPAPPATRSSPPAVGPSVDPAQEETARRERFLCALRIAVRELRSLLPAARPDARLDRLGLGDSREDQLVTCTDDVTCLHLRHAAVRRALETFESDPVVLVFLVSAIWSAVNYWSEAVTDDEEEAVQLQLADRAGGLRP